MASRREGPIHGQHANMPICSNKKKVDESDWRPDYRRTRKLIRGRGSLGLRLQHRQPERLLHVILGGCLRFFYNKTTTLAQRTNIGLLWKTAGQLNLPRTSCFSLVFLFTFFVCLCLVWRSRPSGVLAVGLCVAGYWALLVWV